MDRTRIERTNGSNGVQKGRDSSNTTRPLNRLEDGDERDDDDVLCLDFFLQWARPHLVPGTGFWKMRILPIHALYTHSGPELKTKSKKNNNKWKPRMMMMMGSLFVVIVYFWLRTICFLCAQSPQTPQERNIWALLLRFGSRGTHVESGLHLHHRHQQQRKQTAAHRGLFGADSLVRSLVCAVRATTPRHTNMGLMRSHLDRLHDGRLWLMMSLAADRAVCD